MRNKKLVYASNSKWINNPLAKGLLGITDLSYYLLCM